MAQVSKELNIVWNVEPCIHILMLSLSLSMGILLIWMSSPECEEMEHGVCALPIIKEKRRGQKTV